MDNNDIKKNYPHIQDIFDALEINQKEDKVADLIDSFASLLGTIGMAMDVLEDQEINFIDKQKLEMVIEIAINKLDDTMTDIITEGNNG